MEQKRIGGAKQIGARFSSETKRPEAVLRQKIVEKDGAQMTSDQQYSLLEEKGEKRERERKRECYRSRRRLSISTGTEPVP